MSLALPGIGVSRGICEVDGEGYLTVLTERRNIEKAGPTGKYVDETGIVHLLRGDELVSMNMMGFPPSVFAQIDRRLIAFLESNRQTPGDAECLIPVVVGQIVKEKVARVRVLPTSDTWFGVTHAEDKPDAIAIIRAMVERGEYPSPIWKTG